MTDEVEDRIREYLGILGTKPVKAVRVVDKEAVNVLRKRISESDDPIEKLKLHSELEEARRPRLVQPPDPREELEAVFVTEAKAWAEANSVTASAFVALKVPRDVLRRAGFNFSGSTGQRASRRAGRLPMDQVTEAVHKLPDRWTIKTLAAELNRDVATTRNYVRRLQDEGLIKVVGENASRQGRPSKLYSLAR
jgi:hypothetical protein